MHKSTKEIAREAVETEFKKIGGSKRHRDVDSSAMTMTRKIPDQQIETMIRKCWDQEVKIWIHPNSNDLGASTVIE
jgi:hypothetical protein